LRTGPLVRRGANVSRAGQAPPIIPRMLPRGSGKQNPSLTAVALPRIAPKAGTRSTCRLPINLRSFLAAQLGCQSDASDDTILSRAACADQSTLNKLARAIRRYSTERAHEAWVECRLAVMAFVEAHRHGDAVVLCLRCIRVDFGDAAYVHQRSGCVPITLGGIEPADTKGKLAEEVAQRIQRLVEEFRALRAAFGLPHFDLDCYVRGDHITLMWRPLP
jgi:hypothetical protein